MSTIASQILTRNQLFMFSIYRAIPVISFFIGLTAAVCIFEIDNPSLLWTSGLLFSVLGVIYKKRYLAHLNLTKEDLKNCIASSKQLDKKMRISMLAVIIAACAIVYFGYNFITTAYPSTNYMLLFSTSFLEQGTIAVCALFMICGALLCARTVTATSPKLQLSVVIPYLAGGTIVNFIGCKILVTRLIPVPIFPTSIFFLLSLTSCLCCILGQFYEKKIFLNTASLMAFIAMGLVIWKIGNYYFGMSVYLTPLVLVALCAPLLITEISASSSSSSASITHQRLILIGIALGLSAFSTMNEHPGLSFSTIEQRFL